MTYSITSETIFKQPALCRNLNQTGRASAVLWKSLVLGGNVLHDPMESMITPKIFVPKTFHYITGHFHPESCFLDEGGHSFSFA